MRHRRALRGSRRSRSRRLGERLLEHGALLARSGERDRVEEPRLQRGLVAPEREIVEARKIEEQLSSERGGSLEARNHESVDPAPQRAGAEARANRCFAELDELGVRELIRSAHGVGACRGSDRPSRHGQGGRRGRCGGCVMAHPRIPTIRHPPIDAVVIVPESTWRPGAESHVVAQGRPPVVEGDVDALAGVRVAIVLVEAPSRELAQVAIRICPQAQLRFMKMAAQEQVHTIGEEAPALGTVCQVRERVMNHREPKPGEAIREAPHLLVRQPQLALLVVVAGEPRRVEPDHVNRERPARDLDAIPEARVPVRRIGEQVGALQRRRDPVAVSPLSIEDLVSVRVRYTAGAFAAGHPPGQYLLLVGFDAAERFPDVRSVVSINVVIAWHDEEPRPRHLGKVEQPLDEVGEQRVLLALARLREIAGEADEIERSAGDDLGEVLLPLGAEDASAAPPLRPRLVTANVQIGDVEKADLVLLHRYGRATVPGSRGPFQRRVGAPRGRRHRSPDPCVGGQKRANSAARGPRRCSAAEPSVRPPTDVAFSWRRGRSMFRAVGILSHDQLLEVHDAVLSAGLSDGRDALLVGLDRAFVASLPQAPTPSERVLAELGKLNEAETLEDGTVPLSTYLRNAMRMARAQKEAAIFKRALDQAAAASTATAHEPSRLAEMKRAGSESNGSALPTKSAGPAEPFAYASAKSTNPYSRPALSLGLLALAGLVLLAVYTAVGKQYEIHGQLWDTVAHRPIVGAEILFVGPHCDGGTARTGAEGSFNLKCRVPPFVRIREPRVRIRLPGRDAYCPQPVLLLEENVISVIEVGDECVVASVKPALPPSSASASAVFDAPVPMTADGGLPLDMRDLGSTCQFSYPEHTCPLTKSVPSGIEKAQGLLVCGVSGGLPGHAVIAATDPEAAPIQTGLRYHVRASTRADGYCGNPNADKDVGFKVYTLKGEMSVHFAIPPEAFEGRDEMYFCVTARSDTASRVSGRMLVRRRCP